MKLELKHIAPYLPYGLKIKTYKSVILELNPNMLAVNPDGFNNFYYWFISQDSKPILHPLSDLTKEIEVNGEKFVPYDYFYDDPENDWFGGNIWLKYMFEGNTDKTDLNFIPYYIVQSLFKWHFDVFGLIEKGLAIDKNTLEL